MRIYLDYISFFYSTGLETARPAKNDKDLYEPAVRSSAELSRKEIQNAKG